MSYFYLFLPVSLSISPSLDAVISPNFSILCVSLSLLSHVPLEIKSTAEHSPLSSLLLWPVKGGGQMLGGGVEGWKVGGKKDGGIGGWRGGRE